MCVLFEDPHSDKLRYADMIICFQFVFGASTMDYIRYQAEATWSVIRKFEKGPSFETWQEKRLYSEKDQEGAETHEMSQIPNVM